MVHSISLHASRENGRMDQPCCVPPKPFIFVLDTAEFIPCPLQLCLQALNANHSLHQVLVKICILLLQRPKQKKNHGEWLFEICSIYKTHQTDINHYLNNDEYSFKTIRLCLFRCLYNLNPMPGTLFLTILWN